MASSNIRFSRLLSQLQPHPCTLPPIISLRQKARVTTSPIDSNPNNATQFDTSTLQKKLQETISSFIVNTGNSNQTSNYSTEYIMNLFEKWFDIACECHPTMIQNPNAMCLSTLLIENSNNNNNNNNQSIRYPDSRFVLLKRYNKNTGDFIFYTNYNSNKSIQIQNNPFVSLCFYWDCLNASVRIRGDILLLPKKEWLNKDAKNQISNNKIDDVNEEIVHARYQRLIESSDEYWNSRPFESRIASYTSDQSSKLDKKDGLEKKQQKNFAKYQSNVGVPRPDNWGAYVVRCKRIEFWKGEKFRFHDRVVFDRIENDDSRNDWKQNVLLEKSKAKWKVSLLQP